MVARRLKDWFTRKKPEFNGKRNGHVNGNGNGYGILPLSELPDHSWPSRPNSELNGNVPVPPPAVITKKRWMTRPKFEMNGKVAVPSADLPKHHIAGEKIKAEEIRELCDLVRKRFALDVEIWNLRYAKERDRDRVREKIDKADATLAKIRRTLASWDRRDMFESVEDWEVLEDIKGRINLDNKRDWITNPPWSGE
jgi:hypothetical protein